MSDEKPCPFCGDDSEYFRFLDLCAERANEIWRENEVKVTTGVYNSMNFIEVVRCRNCKHYNNDGCSYFVLAKYNLLHIDNPDGYCSWGIRKEEYYETDC